MTKVEKINALLLFLKGVQPPVKNADEIDANGELPHGGKGSDAIAWILAGSEDRKQVSQTELMGRRLRLFQLIDDHGYDSRIHVGKGRMVDAPIVDFYNNMDESGEPPGPAK